MTDYNQQQEEDYIDQAEESLDEVQSKILSDTIDKDD